MQSPATARRHRCVVCCSPPYVRFRERDGIVDVSLRGGERAFDLIDRLNERGVRVIVISGYAELPLVSEKAMAFLQKPVSEAELMAALRPLIAQKAAR